MAGMEIAVATCEWLKALTAEAPRFPAFDVEQDDRSPEDLLKGVKKLALPEFHPDNEEEFEDWVDEAAARVRRTFAPLKSSARPGFAWRIVP